LDLLVWHRTIRRIADTSFPPDRLIGFEDAEFVAPDRAAPRRDLLAAELDALSEMTAFGRVLRGALNQRDLSASSGT
jgi:hypothetical protein